MIEVADLSETERVAKLTDKQRECLHLVVLRKSSKEIARILDISKPAVDQRLLGARRTLDVGSRNEAALMFARVAGTYDPIIYDPAYLPSDDEIPESGSQDAWPDEKSFMLEEAPMTMDAFGHGASDWSWVPKDPGRDLGTVQRIAIIVGMTVGILGIILIGLSVSQTLSALLA